MDGSHQQSQRNQSQYTYRSNDVHGSSVRNPQEQRREFLWRERVRLELQVQALIAHGASLTQQWQHLREKKAASGNQIPKIATQILFAGIARLSQLSGERFYHYQKERLAQEEYRIQQEIIRCNADALALQSQITVLDFELSLL